MADTPENGIMPSFDEHFAILVDSLEKMGASPQQARQVAAEAVTGPSLTKPSRYQPPDMTGVRAGQFGLPPMAPTGPEMRSRDPVSTGDMIARNVLGEAPSDLRRKAVEGVTGYTGLGPSQNVPISAFDVAGVNPILDYENKLAAGDMKGAALELAPFALPAAGRGAATLGEKIANNPKTTAAVAGALSYFGSPSEAGPGDKAPAGQSFAPNEDRMRTLYEERATLARQLDEVRQRREQNRPRGRMPSPQGDPQFTAADTEYRGLEAKLQGLEATIERESQRGSPQALAEAQRIQAELDKELARKRSETPTRELYPDLVSSIPYYTGAAGLLLGGAVKARKTANYNNTAADISNRMADAVDEAYNALAGKRTQNKLAEAQMQTLRAEQLGRELATTKQPGFFDPKVSAVGGLTGVVGAFAPEEIDLARGGKVADKVFESAYEDPLKMAKRAGAGFVMGMAPAELGGAATWAAMQKRTPPGFGPETAALRDALDRAGVPRYPNQGTLGLPPAVQGGRLEVMPGSQTSNLLPPPGTVLDQASMPLAGSSVARNRLAGDETALAGRGLPSVASGQQLGPEALSNRPPSEILGSIQRAPRDVPTTFPQSTPAANPAPVRSANMPEWASEPPQGIKLSRGQFWDGKINQPRNADGTLAEMPKYKASRPKAEKPAQRSDEIPEKPSVQMDDMAPYGRRRQSDE
jgi:hypothetical protein